MRIIKVEVCVICRIRRLRRITHVTVPKLWISQSEALFTVMIFYDIKSMTWYPTISWTVCETCIFLQTLEAKTTTEIQRNVKLLHLLNEKVIYLTVRERKKNNFAPKLEAATLAGARVNFTDSAESFLVQNGAGFSKFLSELGLPRFRKCNSKQKN